MSLGKFRPLRHALFSQAARDQAVAQLYGRILAMFLVTNTNFSALLIRHQGQAMGAGKRALVKFGGSPHVHHGRVAQK